MKVIGKVKLCPNTAAWNDPENNIFLSRAGRKQGNVKEGADMKNINAGVKAGLIEYREVQEPVANKATAAKKNNAKKATEVAKKAAAKKKEEAKQVEQPAEEVKPVENNVQVNVKNEGDEPKAE